jgi:hypothetical protein
MKLQVHILAIVFLALTVSANAKVQPAEDEFVPSIFLRQAPEDYLPIEVDLERRFGVFGSNDAPDLDDLLDSDDGTGDYFDYGDASPANSAMNVQTNANGVYQRRTRPVSRWTKFELA